jgi:hypothetical protein
MIFIPIGTEPCATTATGKITEIAESYVPIFDYKISGAIFCCVIDRAYVMSKMFVGTQS